MKSTLYVITVLGVFGLAFWAYRENYATQQALSEKQALQGDIGAAQTRLNVLRAEWAYLNRPDRLWALAEINFDRLGLLPLKSDQFGRVEQVRFPRTRILEFSNGVDVLNPGDGN
ncbi:MAG: cell division protein FtsL [Rhodobacteraceae bacterium]|nr:cell division protein FtsL [Paracoccaceae bacterium]